MKKFLSLLGLFAATSAFAQLTVKQDGTSESFIYVTDQVLYVADDISVTKYTEATNETAKAGIYLRDDAQLIQGEQNESNSNSGTGFISVYQDSNSDSYDYNFWSSPVASSDATNNFSIANQIYNPGDSNITTEVSNFTGSWNGSGESGIDYNNRTPLSISTAWLYKFNQNNNSWSYLGSSGTVAPGYGFTMKGTNVTTGGTYNVDTNNQFYEFRGRANSGDIVVDLAPNAGAVTLAGNPYPSALDLTAFFNDPANNGVASIMYWDEDRTVNSHYYVDNKGGYGTWIPTLDGDGQYTVPTFMNYDNNGNATTSTNVQGENIARRYAPIGQGLILKRDGDLQSGPLGNPTATFKNSHRVYVKEGANSVFRSPERNNRSLIRFHVIFDDYSHYRDMILNFHERATLGFDRGGDAPHPMDGGQKEAYFTIQNDGNGEAQRNLVIQSVPFSMNMSIPIAFKMQEQGRVRIKAAEELNVPYHRVLLLDTQDNMRYPIMGESSSIGGGLTVQLTLPAGTYENRFFIVFEDAPEEDPGHPDERSVVADDFDFVQDNRAKQLEVANPEMHKVDEVNIYDMSGKLVYYAYGLGSASRYSFPTYNFADGVYMVRLVTENDGVVSYKMSVMNR
ncbi:T9SS type A sorting domain-containing protein [Flavobacteriaceae bacterium]|nr:T9SS type A sorting domain-containing protein [Flavobacteriaceae bacterium]